MTSQTLLLPDWVPSVRPGARILIIGASGGLGTALVQMLQKGSETCVIGAHGSSKPVDVSPDENIIHVLRTLKSEADCTAVVDEFFAKAGGIDALVVLAGGIHFSGHWKNMPATKWEDDIDINLSYPFYLARAAMRYMSAAGSGRILMTGTESALHGGSATSFPYAIAKRGTECLVEGLAREGAANGVLVNGVRLGCIRSGFHERWHNKTDAEMVERIALIPLKRAGTVEEAAALMIYLLSDWSQFITGQMIPLTGGDWL